MTPNGTTLNLRSRDCAEEHEMIVPGRSGQNAPYSVEMNPLRSTLKR